MIDPVIGARRSRLYNRLRSGKDKQGRRALKEEDRYCCMGIMCELYREEFTHVKWEKQRLSSVELFLGNSDVLPRAVSDYFGFSNINPTVHTKDVPQKALESFVKCYYGLRDDATVHCGCMNDQLGLTFPEIAHALEKMYPCSILS